jgi:hypothetical protein
VTTYQMPKDYDQGLMDAVRDWLKANDIDPKNMPLHSEVTVTDRISYFEQTRGNGVTWMARTKPLISPMPPELAARWRIPPTICPHCGGDINDGPTSAPSGGGK